MHRHLVFVLTVVTALAWASNLHAQRSRVVVDPVKVRAWVSDNKAALRAPAMAAGIVTARETPFLDALGAESDEPFLIGSLSKSVTAVAIAILVHDGQIGLDDPASDWVTGVPNTVTIRHLLHQTSGLDRRAGGNAWTDTETSLASMIDDADWGPALDAFEYSNLNYHILGAIVEKVSGKPYGTFVGDEIFEPLGMKTASAHPQPPANHVAGHRYLFGFPAALGEPDYNPVAVPAGFVWMSADDMATWLRMFVARGTIEQREAIPSEVVDMVLQKPEDTPYAMGWLVRSEHDPPYANHAGATAAFTSAMAVVPDRGFGVFVLTNVNTFQARGAVDTMDGLLASIAVVEPRATSNFEFVARLGMGLFVVFIVLALAREALHWMRGGFRRTLISSERWKVLAIVVINVGVVAFVELYLDTSILAIAIPQPDLGITFLAIVVGLTVWQILRSFNKSALFALTDDDESDDPGD